ncbi:uncharacterized protein LOC108696898 [Xenopus laevis]|uniref:Uncharacterized protein LOC108696898 n=2 Tax=Xenopus laevis TaxID=8355 RepID=A0A1L8FPJ3_XENLA|nr:uncharacterized protein LOC108696898 [Xenopus laevis]XP_041425737.1 uncharacterized protein LOC108696898 [Xenopus laevis]OCT73514.1 hypothetical protein XELAEV_18036490mg [Xenopus laevis]
MTTKRGPVTELEETMLPYSCVRPRLLHSLLQKIHFALKSGGQCGKLQITLIQLSLLLSLLFGTALPFPNNCHQYRFSTNGEHLLNQHLSIKIGTTTEYCSFQMKFPKHKETCTNSSHVTLVNDTCLLLQTMDLEYKTFYLEYGAGKVGRSAEALFEGFCQHKDDNEMPPSKNPNNIIAIWASIGVIVPTIIAVILIVMFCRRRKIPHSISLKVVSGLESNTSATNEAELLRLNEEHS